MDGLSCGHPVLGLKRDIFYILVLELLALLRVEEELREREFFWPIWKFRCFNFSTFAGLRVNNNFISIALLSYVQGGLLPDLCPCLPGIACGHPLTMDTHLQFPGLQLFYLVL